MTPDDGAPQTKGPAVILQQYYLGCLSHASYLVGDESSGRAIVVDPRRDVAAYLEDARRLGLEIVGVFNTHFHADFVAGHQELARATGAWIGYGARAQGETGYAIRTFADGDTIELGGVDGVVLRVLATPGHTWESCSLLVHPKGLDAAPDAVLSGDTLFIGDVGRPDLAAAVGADPLELAAAQFDSVRRLLDLPSAVRVLPAHGAGSACGKNLSAELESTIGAQRLTNPMAAIADRDEFIARLTDAQPAIPAYFARDAVLNRSDLGAGSFSDDAALLDPATLVAALEAGATVVDLRTPEEFARAHLRGSLNVGLAGRFAETLGMVVELDAPLVFVGSPGDAAEATTRAARIGADRVVGLADAAGLEEISRRVPGSVVSASRLSVTEAETAVAAGALWLDVRNPGEVADAAVPGSLRIPLAELPRRVAEVPADREVVVHCAGGWRSSVAASVLRAAGHGSVADLFGGFAAWQVAHGSDGPLPEGGVAAAGATCEAESGAGLGLVSSSSSGVTA